MWPTSPCLLIVVAITENNSLQNDQLVQSSTYTDITSIQCVRTILKQSGNGFSVCVESNE